MTENPTNLIDRLKNLVERIVAEFKKVDDSIGNDVDYIALYESILSKSDDQAGEAVVSVGGRKLYRHASGMGTVVEFNDGQDRRVLVLDAQYRKYATMMSSEYNNTSLPDYYSTNTNGSWFIDGGSANTTPASCASLTDATLNNLWQKSIDVNTSKYNTDIWLTQPDCEAATHCRSITVNGVGCDIPNIQTLLRIFCEGVLLDELDPTISSYPDVKLTNWFSYGHAWSSTEYGSGTARRIFYTGKSNDNLKDLALSVCPVLEL